MVEAEAEATIKVKAEDSVVAAANLPLTALQRNPRTEDMAEEEEEKEEEGSVATNSSPTLTNTTTTSSPT